MTPVRVDIRKDLPLVHGRPIYRRNDLGLIYDVAETASPIEDDNLSAMIDQQFGIREPGNLFVQADTLTLVFRAQGGVFVSLDAYTNCDRWQRSTEALPPVGAGSGALTLTERVESDRISFAILPQYRFNSEASTLSIVLGGRATHYFEVGDDIFVGVASGILTEVVLTNLIIT